MQFRAVRYDTGVPVEVALDGPRIARVTPLPVPSRSSESLPIVAPGFIDAQVNGYRGQEFSSFDLTAERVASIAEDFYAFGVTQLYPTLTTQSFECHAHGLRTIAAACDQLPAVGRAMPGIHVEGPYFSKEDGPRGAHPAEHCRPPCWNEFQRLQEAAAGRIRLLTMSPEFDNAPDFISRAAASGVVIAIGHTGASGDQIRAAVDAGAQLSTHLGNGAHRMLRRHPNYIWDQLGEDRLMASFIVDGHHLPPEVVRSMIRAKGVERSVLVSDISGLAGMPVGRYQSSGCELEILADGRLVIAGQDQLLAGAAAPIGIGVANAMRFAGVDLTAAVRMATSNPARLLGLPEVSLRPGDPADLVLFRLPPVDAAGRLAGAEGLRIEATIASGERVFSNAS